MSNFLAALIQSTATGTTYTLEQVLALAAITGGDMVTAINGALGSTVWQTGTGPGSTNTVLNGTAAPTTQGVNGDFYLNTTNYRLYGPKASGAWPGTYVSLIGPQGNNGSPGSNGSPGTNGTNGIGVPAGGAIHEYARKASATSGDTEWHTLVWDDLTDVISGTNYIGTTKGFRPGQDDDLSPIGAGYIFESVNDGHLYWSHRDGSVHCLCFDGIYGGGGGGGSNWPYSPGYAVDGSYHASYADYPPTSLIVTANRQYFVPFYLGYAQTLSAIAVYISGTAVVGSHVRLGIYTSAPNGTPGTLVADGGAIATDSVGNKPVTFTGVGLGDGWYWLSAIFSHASTVVADACLSGSRLRLKSMTESVSYFAFTSQSYGALPSAPVGTVTMSDATTYPTVPRIGIAVTAP